LFFKNSFVICFVGEHDGKFTVLISTRKKTYLLLKTMQLSIIIPTYNEEKGISSFLIHLQKAISVIDDCEIIIVDGGSSDRTLKEVKCISNQLKLDIKLCVSPKKGRAVQMNYGANKSSGDFLYFLHADTFPPNEFDRIIFNFVKKNIQAGSFRMKFDKRSIFFNFWSWFTRFKWNIASGGDQSLFVSKDLFRLINGFDENWPIMEDVDIIVRIKKKAVYDVIPRYVITSTRKYNQMGSVKLQSVFVTVQIKRILGVNPQKIHAYYKRKLYR